MKLKSFQREDYARLALHDGAILAHDTGLGKSWASMAWPLLKVGWHRGDNCIVPDGCCLLVAPGDLHRQLAEEACRHFGVRLVPLETRADVERHTERLDGARVVLHPGYYITSYTQLATNGVRRFADLEKQGVEAAVKAVGVPEVISREWWEKRGDHYEHHYAALEIDPTHSGRQLKAVITGMSFNLPDWLREQKNEAYHTLRKITPEDPSKGYDGLTPEQRQFVAMAAGDDWLEAGAQGIGEFAALGGRRVRCVYDASLADLLALSFDCVVVDEGTKMKGGRTLIGNGVRRLEPPYRLVLTATPIKNRLPDLFWLAWWAAGGHTDASPRWPYADSSEEQTRFAEAFLVSEQNLTKERKAAEEGKRRRFQKLSAEVCNIHHLWKLIGPMILRRRKQDAGEDIVDKVRHVVRVPMGFEQAKVYKSHLDHEYLDKQGKPAPGAKLQALRMVAAAPAAAGLVRADPEIVFDRSEIDYIPKVASALNLVRECLGRREQVVVFSALIEPLDVMEKYLDQAGVPCVKLDGRKTQKRRAKEAARFKAGPDAAQPVPVLLAGVESMAEGHSWHLCPNAVLLAYSWAYDKFEQAINRVHRINSPKDVQVYSVVCDGTVDRKLESLIAEKGDSAALVLDGQLLGERQDEVNLAELLSIAANEFSDENTLCEVELEQQWPELRAALTAAWMAWLTRGSDRPEREGDQPQPDQPGREQQDQHPGVGLHQESLALGAAGVTPEPCTPPKTAAPRCGDQRVRHSSAPHNQSRLRRALSLMRALRRQRAQRETYAARGPRVRPGGGPWRPRSGIGDP